MMKIKKSMLALAAMLGCFTASAQQAEEVTEYVFNPHWYVQGQVGGQETLGESSFGKMLSFNAQAGLGYQFSPLFGARLSVNGWQSRAAIELSDTRAFDWHWAYASPMVDLTFSLTNALLGYNPERLCDLNVFAGIGANIAWHNGRAAEVQQMIQSTNKVTALQNLWDGTKARLTGRLGAALDFRITDNLKAGIELQANLLNDRYNSKKAGNADWYFNGLVGVKYCFGTTYNKRVIKNEPQVIIQEKIVEKIVEVPVDVITEDSRNTNAMNQTVTPELKRDVFFTISNTKISVQEMTKVAEIAEFLKEYPSATVTVTGYADKGTGTKAINLRLSRQRAQAVVDALINKYGIAPSRITMESMSDTEVQPFSDPVLNRVAICVAK